MPSVSGNIYFSSTRTVNSGTAIANVPIVLRDTTTGVGITVLTSATGTYTFNNVPAGSYSLVEAWGQTGGVPSPADFSTAAVMSAPTPKDPPVSQVTAPPAGTNIIDSVSPNTLNITVAASNLTAENFTDAPREDIPFIINDVTLMGSNLITAADNGIWGTLPAGTAVNTRPATEPYPGVSPNFTYTSNLLPNAGQYTVSNIQIGANAAWWNLANHTTGDETGRFQSINGGPVGNVFFTQTITLKPNTNYLFSSWFANMVKTVGYPAGPGVRITTPGGATIFSTGATNIPSNNSILIWNEIGSFFNSGNNTTVVLNFLDVNGGAAGNDYAADDFSLYEADPNNILITSNKYVDKSIAALGDTITYTIVVRNTGVSTSQSIKIIDTIPSGTSFVTSSVTVDGASFPTKNPSPITGMTIPDLGGGMVSTVTFKVTLNTVPSPNPIPNSASIYYGFAPIAGGATIPNATSTSIVNTLVQGASFNNLTKSVSENFGTAGDTLVYTIVLQNTGNITASNVVFTDTIPSSTSFLPNSFTINGIAQVGANPSPPGVTIPDIAVGGIVTLTFNVQVTTIPTTNPIKNQGKVSFSDFNTTIPNAAITNVVSTTISFIALSSSKIVNKSYGNIGDILTYTIPISNLGNTTATNVVFIDTLPSYTTFIVNSFKQDGVVISGSPNGAGVTLPNAIGVSGLSTVTFQVQITSLPSPNPILNSATSAASFIVDSTTTPNRVGTATISTNIVSTTVNNANLSNISKLADKSYADCGDIITYTIIIPNTGNVTAQNVLFKDTIPSGVSLVANSVTINGVTQSGANPQTGVTIPNIPGFSITTVTFQVQVQC